MMHEGEDGYDDSKAEVMAVTQQTDPQVSSIGLNMKKIDDTEAHATGYQGEDIGMIRENEQGQGTQQIRLKKVKNNHHGAGSKEQAVRRRNIK